MSDAFTASGVVTWPESDDFGDPAQSRFHDISDEIERQVSETIMPALAEAFIKTANAVLARERRRQRRARPNGD